MKILNRWKVATIAVIVAFILGSVCWGCLGHKLKNWWSQTPQITAVAQAKVDIDKPHLPVYDPSVIGIYFNYTELNDKDPKEIYLSFQFKTDKMVNDRDQLNRTKMVKCLFNTEYAKALIDDHAQGWIEISKDKCKELLP